MIFDINISSMCFCMSEGILIVSLYEPISLTSVLVTPADSGLIAGNELVDSVSPRPGLRRSGTRRGRSFLHWSVGSWRNISRCWRRTPPGAAPTSPAGCWGYEAPPGCSPAPNCTLTGDRWEYIFKKYSYKWTTSTLLTLQKFHRKTCEEKCFRQETQFSVQVS